MMPSGGSVDMWIKHMFGKRKNKEPDLDEKIKRIADHYGQKYQVEKAIEEILELHAELLLAAECGGKTILPESTWQEIADVMIMCYQLAYLFGKEELIGMWSEYKVERQLARMAVEEQNLHFDMHEIKMEE